MKQSHKRILGIDYGEKKTGIAFAEGPLAEPVEVIYHQTVESLLNQLQKVVQKYEPEMLVIGMPSGMQGEEVKEVIDKIKEEINLPIEVVDEGFSTREAQMLSRDVGMARKKRKRMEDAYAASIILQKYLDNAR